MKSSKINILHWFFAISTTITFYIVLLLVFSPIYDIDQKNQDHSSANSIVMFTVGKDKDKNNKMLQEWMEINNPTLVINPSREYNYSRILARKHNFVLNMNDCDEMINHSVGIVSIYNNAHVALIPLPKDSTEKYELFYLPQLPDKLLNSMISEVKYPYFTDYYTGRHLNITIRESLVSKNKIDSAKVINPTIVQVLTSRDKLIFPRVKLIKSCGDSELDNAAIKAIISKSLSSDSDFKRNDNITVAVTWKSNSNLKAGNEVKKK